MDELGQLVPNRHIGPHHTVVVGRSNRLFGVTRNALRVKLVRRSYHEPKVASPACQHGA